MDGKAGLKIKLISYNIHSGRNLMMKPQLNKIIDFLKIEKPDLICLQEVNENKKRGFQISKIKNELMMETHSGPHVDFKEGYYGIATFSNFPIIEKKHILLDSTGEQRGLTDTVVFINNISRVHILNTHLSIKIRERRRQIHQLQDYLNSLTYPYVLAGDFNTTNLFFNDTLIDTGKEKNKEHLPTMMLHKKRLDYIFVSKDFIVTKYQVLPVKMSDHYPIIVELGFQTRALE